MKKRNLSLNSMNVFCAVIEQGGFHNAANFLDLSEPAVSQQIKKIEESVGSYLIERRGTPKLTESGVLFYNYAKQTLNSYECVCGQISNLEKGIEGKITVAAGSSVSKYLLPNVSRKMHQKYPNINIDILYCKLNDVFEHIDCVNSFV